MKRNNGEKNLLKYKGESASEILKRYKDIDGPIEHRRDEEGKCRTKENSRLKVDQATIDSSAFDDFNVRSKSQVNKVIRGGRHAEDLSSVLVSFELYDKISCTNYDRYAEEKEERDEEDDFANMLSRSEWRIENQRSMPVTYMRKAGFGRFREVGFVERSSYPFRIVGLAKFKGRHHREKDVRLQFRKSPGSSVFTVVPR
ncbi:hypothetical protein HZH66_001245 [Vespula vulgaris]|uniref:Uncharacterized protein n=1 Tax=Vespula vulgaris TaxID=7454 RepID=A0A834KW47_VESVU|nr:hypothetical protein HZH66_001245 [Vespula vulgaris]